MSDLIRREDAIAEVLAYLCSSPAHDEELLRWDMEQLIRALPAALNPGKEVMPDGTSKVPNNDIGPGDQAVAGAALPEVQALAMRAAEAVLAEFKDSQEQGWTFRQAHIENAVAQTIAMIRKGDQP